jgi:hypothetical protein
MTRPIARAAAAGLAAAAVTAAAAGCASGHPAPRSTSGAAHGTRDPTPRAVSSAVLTGPQLSKLLPSQAGLPRGWTWGLGEGSTGAELVSGASLNPPPYLTVLPRESCQQFQGVDTHFLLSDYEAGDAKLTTTLSLGKNTDNGGIDIASYYPGWAVKQFRNIEQFAFDHCKPFRVRDPITRAMARMTTKATTVTGVGNQAILINVEQANGPLPDGTYYPGNYALVARVGNYIANVDAPAFPVTSPARAVSSIMAALVSRLRGIG